MDHNKAPASQLSPRDMEAAEANAVQQFMTHFAEPAAKCNASQGFFPYTKRFYRNAASDSPIMLAIVALALAVTASSTMCSDSVLKRQARIRYGDAMRKVGEALNDPIESRSDGTIMTVILLSNIGVFLDTPAPIPHVIIHSTAAAHLLKPRGREMAKDAELLQLLMRMRLTLAYSHTMRALPVQDLVDDNDPEALSWSELPTHVRTHPTHVLNSIIIPVADLRARVKELLDLPVDVSSLAVAAGLVRECTDAELALQRWLQEIPADWKEDKIDHRDIRVQVSDTENLGATPRPGQDTSNPDEIVVTNLHDLRPALGTPFLSVRALTIANSALIIPAPQQRWIKSVLKILGNQLELSTASTIAETPLGYEHPLFGVHPPQDSIDIGSGSSSTATSTATMTTTTTSPTNSMLQTPSPP
ncbi:hypothetical protein DV737_g3489, partial [Chaetothyriales sp. CBS 132003]